MINRFITPSDEEIGRIGRESEERRKREPYAERAIYNARNGVLKVTLRGGSVISVGARSLRGLQNATNTQLANVHIRNGTALFWDDVDVQHSLIAFLGDALGIPTVSDNARRAGLVRSEVKAAAVRANGAKGGRPRKAETTQKQTA